MVDISDASGRPDPVEDFKVITAELASFDPELPKRPTIIVASKADVANPDKLKKLTTYAKRRKMPIYPISGVTGEGLDPLKYAIAAAVREHRPVVIEEVKEEAAQEIKRAYPPPAASARRNRR